MEIKQKKKNWEQGGKNGKKKGAIGESDSLNYFYFRRDAGLLHLRHDFSGKILRLFLNPLTKLKAHIL